MLLEIGGLLRCRFSERAQSELAKSVVSPDIHLVVLDGAGKLLTESTLDDGPFCVLGQTFLTALVDGIVLIAFVHKGHPLKLPLARIPVVPLILIVVIILLLIIIWLLISDLHILIEVRHIQIIHIFHLIC